MPHLRTTQTLYKPTAFESVHYIPLHGFQLREPGTRCLEPWGEPLASACGASAAGTARQELRSCEP